MNKVREFNFDGLIGPTHNYSGLSFGNVASADNVNQVSNPKEAALQGLAKMRMLMQRGFPQAVLPPHSRPHFPLLRQLGFTGTNAQVIKAAARTAPVLLACAYSAAPMWTANAATVSPAADTLDGRVHITVANLNNKLHRAFEHQQTERVLRAIFKDETHFVIHPALPPTPALGDEGAANHMRLDAKNGKPGIELFVYGHSAFEHGKKNEESREEKRPRKFPARQTLEASQAIARLHGLSESCTIFVQQNPAAIDSGVFHNDVIAVANGQALFYHQEAFINEAAVIENCRIVLRQLGAEFFPIRVDTAQVPLADAVSSYLFNSQLLTKPNGKMLLCVPQECFENKAVAAYLQTLIRNRSVSFGVIDEIISVQLRQSMKNGGGPACLRLRVALTEQQAKAMHQGIIFTEELYARLVTWVESHYRDQLAPADLADPSLAVEVQVALTELSDILGLPQLYEFS
jgi:succinylarginine dihydrolase